MVSNRLYAVYRTVYGGDYDLGVHFVLILFAAVDPAATTAVPTARCHPLRTVLVPVPCGEHRVHHALARSSH